MISEYELKQKYRYDPDTGLFTRLFPCGQSSVGSLDRGGHRQIKINGKMYYAHRLAFLYMTGAFPEGPVDHRNCVRDDNRWCNLRPASANQNQHNALRRKDNTTGFKGVYSVKGKWTALVVYRTKRYHLGTFDTVEEANEVRQLAAEMLHAEFVRHA